MNHDDARQAYQELTRMCGHYSQAHPKCSLRDNPYYIALLALEEKMDLLGIATEVWA